MTDIRSSEPFDPHWQPLYSTPVDFAVQDFIVAIDNLVRNPGVNSTVLLRADYYLEFTGKAGIITNKLAPLDESWLSVNISDIIPRTPQLDGWLIDRYIVRRNIPRNPHRDVVVNQTCVLYTNETRTSCFLAYFPHCDVESMPFYLPRAKGVGILYSQGTASVHYQHDTLLTEIDPQDRLIRIGYHLLNTAVKHSRGVQTGYKKRVHHDVVIGRKQFQDTYIYLKQKYAGTLMANWAEKTDPKKHVFEDLGIAAFLIELWKSTYNQKTDFNFMDLGCGNGLLVNVLIQEGYRGQGIDIRARKSWLTYSKEVQACLREGILMPSILNYPTESTTTTPPLVPIGQSPPKVDSLFIIGNHSDELTLWLPLLGHPFMVIPCCSHSLSGLRTRFSGKDGKSAYQALCDKVVETAKEVGWKPEVEFLRIPSTRNGAIIGRKLVKEDVNLSTLVSTADGEDWIECAKKLGKKEGGGH